MQNNYAGNGFIRSLFLHVNAVKIGFKYFFEHKISLGYRLTATFLTIFSYKEVPLSMAPILGASEYFFVAALSRIFLGEKLSGKKAVGLCVIVIGIVVYSAEKIFPGLLV